MPPERGNAFPSSHRSRETWEILPSVSASTCARDQLRLRRSCLRSETCTFMHPSLIFVPLTTLSVANNSISLVIDEVQWIQQKLTNVMRIIQEARREELHKRRASRKATTICQVISRFSCYARNGAMHRHEKREENKSKVWGLPPHS